MRIQDSIKKLAANQDEVYSCIAKVIKVNGSTVDVDPLSGDATIFDVRLQANIKKSDGLLIKPKNGSFVIVTFINKNVATVTGMAEIDSIEFSNANVKALVDKAVSLEVKNIDLSKEISSMFDKIDSLITLISNIKVLTPVGPSTGLTPDMYPQLIQKQTEFKAIKQRLTTIITPL
jgi:hypothetical protein